MKRDMPHFQIGHEIDLRDFFSMGPLEAGTIRALAALFLVALAAQFWLGRYDMLLSDHGNLMVGIDYVQQNLGLPLQTAKAGFAVLAALLVLLKRPKLALACAAILVVDWVLPPLVSSFYVRPNELTLEKPFIERHLEATRAAYGLDHRARNIDFRRTKKGASISRANKTLLDNVRLWDWRAFHDTLEPEPAAASVHLRRYRRGSLSDRRPSAADAARPARARPESARRRAQSLDQSRA